MTLAKDYGKLMQQRTKPGVEFHFMDFQMFEIVVMDEGSYTTSSNTEFGGEEYCMTLDWDQRAMNQLLSALPTRMSEPIKQTIEGAERLPAKLELPHPITIQVSARLGKAQRSPNEEFIPLIVTKFSGLL